MSCKKLSAIGQTGRNGNCSLYNYGNTTFLSTGKYVPALAYTIHRNNPTAELKVNMHGKNIHHILLRKNAYKVKSYIYIQIYVH
jgi:hypothetical protein